MSNNNKKYKRAGVSSSNADQATQDQALAARIFDDLRTAGLLSDRTLVTASKRDIWNNILKKYFGSVRYEDFEKAVPKPGRTMTPGVALHIQENNQQVLLDFLKANAKHLSPSERNQLLKRIEGEMQSGTLTVDSFQSLKNFIEGGESPRFLPGFAKNILSYIQGDAAIKKYLQSSEAMLPGVNNLATGYPVTLYEVLYNPGIRLDIKAGTNIDDSLKIALSGLEPLLKNKAHALQMKSVISKAVMGALALKIAGPTLLGASQVKGPSDKDKKALLSDTSGPFNEDNDSSSDSQDEEASAGAGAAAPDFVRGTMVGGRFVPDAVQKNNSPSDGGITNGNIGSLGGQFSNQNAGSALNRYYTNQQDKMLPNPTSQSSEITRQNHAQGAVRTAANDDDLARRLFETRLPDLDSVLRQLTVFLNNGEIQKAKNYVLSLDRQYGALVNEILSYFDTQEAQEQR